MIMDTATNQVIIELLASNVVLFQASGQIVLKWVTALLTLHEVQLRLKIYYTVN